MANPFRPAIAVLFIAACASSARESVTKCPEGSVPFRTADQKEPWACALVNKEHRDGADCPMGSRAVASLDRFNPFRCALDSVVLFEPRGACPPGHRAVPTADPEKEFECEKAGAGVGSSLRCPSETVPIPTPGTLQPFVCSPKGARPRQPEPEPLDFGQAPQRLPTIKMRARDRRIPDGVYRVPGRFSLRYPGEWNLKDSWNQSPPTLTIMPNTPSDGRPVALSVVYERRGTREFIDIEARALQEAQWHGAVVKGRPLVSKRKSIELETPEESALLLVPDENGYFILSYSAPSDLFSYHYHAYRSLKGSFVIFGREK